MTVRTSDEEGPPSGRRRKATRTHDDDEGGGPNPITLGDLAEEARRKYLNYALSVITSRALPDVRDGLKPVQRRIIYTMFADLGLTHEARHRKSAKVVGDVIGKYHPHGDTAVYEAMVRLAQDWVMRAPLVDGMGNFGSIDGDSPAAYRYTEARLTKVASELLTELTRDTVDFRPTYDGTGKEPITLPARFPHLLVNGSTGIAVGMATNVPPHNLGEVVRAAIALIPLLPPAREDEAAGEKRRKEALKAALKAIKGPDFPTGGRLVATRKELAELYEEGKGSCKLQGEWKVREEDKSTFIVITSVPYGIEKSALVEEIGDIIAAKKLPQLVGVQDLSTREVCVEIELSRKVGAEPELIMAYLFKHTRLQVTVKYDFTCLVPIAGSDVGRPDRLGLAAILEQFLLYRQETVRRRFEYDLRKLRERIHILEGFEKIFDALDEAIKIIRRSEGKADAAQKLMKGFDLDDIQADAILETRLYRLAKIEILKIREELEEKRKAARKIEAILKSPEKLWAEIRGELEAVEKEFAEPRRTKISDEDVTEEFTAESFIVKEDAIVLVTRDGWIKRQRSINLASTRMREGDEALALVGGSTTESVVLLTNKGSAYNVRINDVPQSTGHGTPVQQLFKFKDGERLVAAVGTDARVMPEFGMPKPELGEEYEEPYPHFLAVTRSGMALRFTLWPHREVSTTRGRMFGKLREGDEFVAVFKVYAEDDVCALTRAGRLLRCTAQEISLLSGPGLGVILVKLDDGDEVAGAFPGSATVEVEKATGGSMKVGAGSVKPTARGGKGAELWKRGAVKKITLPEPTLPDLEAAEAKKAGKKA
ncbi:DNA gyrase/topoisomerase IV subunit A [Nannocystis bainbridge]|uniref:DNA topoisomerase (ATP-hydrolyzing) n=1 Tax=Nannocystis bainbridge TaxID=2995303 RepID=A0ABT5E162_9BACT|nr:DNA topoisomerase (ATP-hydrolyzing) [Nannocystis bainbridge]MDC0719541.1 DNA topoisomerase 4 subunit A [Nannocystis bainbridge]